MGKFSVVYREVTDQARRRARDNTVSSSSYTIFPDGQHPSLQMVRLSRNDQTGRPGAGGADDGGTAQ